MPEKIESEIELLDQAIEYARTNLNDSGLLRGKLEGEINVLKEQINSAKGSESHLQNRQNAVQSEIDHKNKDKDQILLQKTNIDVQVLEITKTRDEAIEKLQQIQDKITSLNTDIENGKNTIINELNQRATIKSKLGRYDTMMEQINIRKAELNSRLLRAKSDEVAREEAIKNHELEFENITKVISNMNQEISDKEIELSNIREKLIKKDAELRENQTKFHQEKSKLEA